MIWLAGTSEVWGSFKIFTYELHYNPNLSTLSYQHQEPNVKLNNSYLDIFACAAPVLTLTVTPGVS